MTIIRKIAKHDVGVLVPLWMAMVDEVNPEYRTPNPAWWMSDTMDLVMYEDGYCGFLAEDEGVIVGFTDGIVYQDPARGAVVAWSRHTYIKPPYRHTSVTKDLFSAIYGDWRDKGARVVLFSCTDEILPLWLAHGYKIIENVMTGVI
jgi:GNAT superfamily N-acetyltransferase